MNVSQFVAKWRKSKLNERSGSHEHFIDLCHVFGHETPGQCTDGTLVFEKDLAKANGRKGRADVWKKDYFAWEYKSQNVDLEGAHEQLRQYRESLHNPPLLVASNMGNFDIRTNFTRSATKTYEFPLEDLSSTDSRRILEYVFFDPDKLNPKLDVEAITAKAAAELADIAKGMRARGLDPKEVALFLDRVVFCLFAQDVRLLEDRVFSRIVEKTHGDPRWISKAVFDLFRTMDKGGDYGLDRIPHFNGDLFADVKPLELKGREIAAIYKVASLDWGEVDPSIIGTLFERGMDPTKEAEIGTHYTRREDISAIVDPVVMAPLQAEWKRVRGEVDDLLDVFEKRSAKRMRAKSPDKDPASIRKARKLIGDYLHDLQNIRILDPACGSGNFLFVTLQKLKDLEKEVLIYASQRNVDDYLPGVGPWQLRGIEKSPYAYDLACMTIWIGWLQWTKDNGYKVDWEPILGSLSDNLRNADAILDLSDPDKPKEPEWPEAEFIVGNPPFLGDKRMRRELGDAYVDALRSLYQARIPGQSDLCCYWFEKARSGVERGEFSRVGLLATQSIRGGASREVLSRIKETGDIFFAASDRPWVQDGANVHVSMVGFDAGEETARTLDGRPVSAINPNLTSASDTTVAGRLRRNRGVSFQGPVKVGPFEIRDAVALGFLRDPTPTGIPNSQVIRPWANGISITQRESAQWIIDFEEMSLCESSKYEAPFEYVRKNVKPERDKTRREKRRRSWWIHGEVNNAFRRSVAPHPRYLATCQTAKHRFFVWLDSVVLPAQTVIAFARSDDYFFGVVHSRLHEVWARALGTQLRGRESGFRYTPTTCFETFPLPEPFAGLEASIGDAAKELDAARRLWLNPPEWTEEETLEFPGTTNGLWARLVVDPDERGIGTVRYSRQVPKDAPCADKLAKRTLTNLYNARPTWLDLAHRRLDEAVFAAYGWKPDLTDDEILARLLALNLERADAEAEAASAPQVVESSR